MLPVKSNKEQEPMSKDPLPDVEITKSNTSSTSNSERDLIEQKPLRMSRSPTKLGFKLTDNTADNIDIVSRVLFPLTFLLFNIGYWITYTFIEI